MKAKDKKNVDLACLGDKLKLIKSHSDQKLSFELLNSGFLLLNLLNINLSLYSLSYFNYNFNLLIFIFLFLSRRTIESIYTYNSVRNHTLLNFRNLSLWILLSIYSLLLTHCVTNLFFNYSLSVILTLICPFSAYKLLTTSSSTRYLDGCMNCFYHMQQISLNSLEVVYCAGYLPYKFFPSSGYHLSFPVFLSTLLTTFVCYSALHVAEFVKRRSAELVFFAFDSGNWMKTEEKAQEEWNPDKKYMRGAVVRHKGNSWKAEGRYNSSEPGKYEAQILNLMFKDPVSCLKKINFFTGLSALIHNIYLFYTPFHYSQVICTFLYGFVLLRNIKICRNLKLPNF